MPHGMSVHGLSDFFGELSHGIFIKIHHESSNENVRHISINRYQLVIAALDIHVPSSIKIFVVGLNS